MTLSSGIWWRAAVHRTPGAYIRSPVVNRFVGQVTSNADGLPIYVELVVNDILEQSRRSASVSRSSSTAETIARKARG
jgi:hypothetical protein